MTRDLVLPVGGDALLTVPGVANRVTGVPLADATVEVTVRDTAGVALPGQSWPLTAIPVSGQAGDYRVLLPLELGLVADQRYAVEVSIDGGQGLRRTLRLPAIARKDVGTPAR